MSTDHQRATPGNAGTPQGTPTAPQGQHQHDEDALDEALDESFPASDPVAVNISSARPDKAKRDAQS